MNTKLGLEVWLETAVDARFHFRSCIKCCTKSYLFFFASFHFIVVVVLVPPSTTSTTCSHHESSGDLPMFDDCWWLLFPTQRRKEMTFFRCKFSVRRWFCVGSNINNFDHTWETVTTQYAKTVDIRIQHAFPAVHSFAWLNMFFFGKRRVRSTVHAWILSTDEYQYGTRLRAYTTIQWWSVRSRNESLSFWKSRQRAVPIHPSFYQNLKNYLHQNNSTILLFWGYWRRVDVSVLLHADRNPDLRR